MVEAVRDLKIHLTLTEKECREIYLHLHPEYHPNDCDSIKAAILNALGYTPQELPDV